MIYAFKPVASLGPFKIGSSSCPIARMEAQALWSPVPLEMAFVVDGGMTEERKVHHLLRTARLHGEWFSGTDQVLGFVDEVIRTSKLPDLSQVGTLGVRSLNDEERCADFLRKRKAGWTLQRIGDEYGITRERVRQVLSSITATQSPADMRNRILEKRDARAKAIILAAKKVDLSTAKVCALARVALRSWSRWERGEGHMSDTSLSRMEAVLDAAQEECAA